MDVFCVTSSEQLSARAPNVEGHHNSSGQALRDVCLRTISCGGFRSLPPLTRSGSQGCTSLQYFVSGIYSSLTHLNNAREKQKTKQKNACCACMCCLDVFFLVLLYIEYHRSRSGTVGAKCSRIEHMQSFGGTHVVHACSTILDSVISLWPSFFAFPHVCANFVSQ